MSTVEGPVTYVTRGAPHYSAGVTIRAKAQSTGIGEDLRFNPEYFLTISGILKIIEVIFAIVALSCISPPLLWFARLFTFFLAITFAITVILCFAYLVTLQNVLFPKFNWILTEFIYSIVASGSLLITAILNIGFSCKAENRAALSYFSSYLSTSYFGTYITAGVFGLFNSIVYGISAYFLYLDWRHQTHTVTPVSNNNSVHY